LWFFSHRSGVPVRANKKNRSNPIVSNDNTLAMNVAHVLHTVVLPNLAEDALSRDDLVVLADVVWPFTAIAIRDFIGSHKMTAFDIWESARRVKASRVVRVLDHHDDMWLRDDWCARWKYACMQNDVQDAADIRARLGDRSLMAFCCAHTTTMKNLTKPERDFHILFVQHCNTILESIVNAIVDGEHEAMLDWICQFVVQNCHAVWDGEFPNRVCFWCLATTKTRMFEVGSMLNVAVFNWSIESARALVRWLDVGYVCTFANGSNPLRMVIDDDTCSDPDRAVSDASALVEMLRLGPEFVEVSFFKMAQAFR
jgi:hypothetical protein